MHRRQTLFLLLLAALAIPLAPAREHDPEAQVKSEIQRLQKSLKEHPVTDAPFGLPEALPKTLDEAAQELSAGRLYVSLEKLQLVEDWLQGARLLAEKEEVAKQGLPAFESRWGKASMSLTALEERSRQEDGSPSPAAVRALLQFSQVSAAGLIDGGRAFATIGTPADGLFNLGQGMGETEFASFAASLHFPANKTALLLRSILPELIALQAKTNAAFQPPKSIDQHGQFMAINSALKVAQELDARKFYAGALYQYLEATLQYGMLNAPQVDSAALAELKSSLQAAGSKLQKSATDESIVQLFQQRAETILSHADGSEPSADERRGLKVYLTEVLPAYFSVRSGPAPSLTTPSGKAATLTLIRWPYT